MVMILLKHYIDLKVFHFNTFIDFKVIEVLQEDSCISFQIFYNGRYFFTLVPAKKKNGSFELSLFDKMKKTAIDWDLFSKIEISLFAILLREPVS